MFVCSALTEWLRSPKGHLADLCYLSGGRGAVVLRRDGLSTH